MLGSSCEFQSLNRACCDTITEVVGSPPRYETADVRHLYLYECEGYY